MTLSKKYYIAIAKLLNNRKLLLNLAKDSDWAEYRKEEIEVITLGLCDLFKKDNPLFDRDKFINAVNNSKLTN